jgi:hypothetical protein
MVYVFMCFMLFRGVGLRDSVWRNFPKEDDLTQRRKGRKEKNGVVLKNYNRKGANGESVPLGTKYG